MTTKNLTNEQLLSTVKAKASHERQLTVEVIELLQEVADRDLHLKMGYGSLLKFCVEELKYSESAAYRRISAVRLAKDVPSIKEDLANGILTLQTASQAQTFLNQERKYLKKYYTPDQKKTLVQDIKNKSSRQVEQFLASKSPELPRPETSRQIQEDKREVRITVDKKLDEKLERLKARYSHKNQNPTLVELVDLMADELLQKSRPKVTAQSKSTPDSIKVRVLESDRALRSKGQDSAQQQFPQTAIKKKEQTFEIKKQHPATPATETSLKIQHSNPRYISRSKREYIMSRDNHQCSYKDEDSGRICGSSHLLEIDHITPVALGGTNDVDNLRLVCRSHNGWFARELGLSRVHSTPGRDAKIWIPRPPILPSILKDDPKRTYRVSINPSTNSRTTE